MKMRRILYPHKGDLFVFNIKEQCFHYFSKNKKDLEIKKICPIFGFWPKLNVCGSLLVLRVDRKKKTVLYFDSQKNKKKIQKMEMFVRFMNSKDKWY